jgi:DNA polymerase III alpha subunit
VIEETIMSDEVQRKAELISFLKFKCYAGFEERGYPLTKEYTDRIEYELGVIDQCGFAEYFLIVADLCRFMREKGIRHMPRGSGAGSAVVWGLGITHRWIDPVALGIPFERFLNPQRVSNPDIDIDIRDDRRHEVVSYTIEKYGAEKVARIITFSFLSAKSAIKDIVRAKNLPDYQALGESMANLIPAGKGDDGRNHRIDDVLKTNEALRDYERLYPDVFAMVRKCEGKARHPSIHAAGTIIAPDDRTNYFPLFYAKAPENREQSDWFPTTQWDMYDCEDRGLLKMDYLGLKTLRVIDETVEAVNIIKGALGHTDTFSIDHVDRHDPKTWDMIGDGQLAGVFQVEKHFVRQFAKRMHLAKKRDPWDLAVLVAIIRPGMMDAGTTQVYLNRAHLQEDPTPPHPLLAETFKKTFGIMVFQEDVMATCVDFAGFTRSEADVVRKGVGKKNPAFIAKQQPAFFEGGMEPLWEARWTDKVTGEPRVMKSKPRNPEFRNIIGTQDFIEGTVQTSDGPVELKMLMPGATREECEHVWSLIEAHSRYCVPADSHIDRAGKKNWQPTVKEMYLCRHDKEWARANGHIGMHWKLRSEGFGKGMSMCDDGRVRQNEIYNIEPSGMQHCFLLTTASGKKVETTELHSFPVVDRGSVQMKDLRVGDRLISHTGYEGYQKGTNPYRITQGTARGGQYIGNGFQSGDANPGYIDGQWAEFQRIRNEMILESSLCRECDQPSERLELDHIDRDRTNNDRGNLRLLCPSCHKKKEYANGRRRRGQKGFPTIEDPIVSIVPTGSKETFNISMSAPYHNFCIDQVVTFNSFNNAHAAVYGMVGTYQTAYLKANWTLPYMMNLINSEGGVTDKIAGYNWKVAEYVDESRMMKLKVYPPCVQRSKAKCSMIWHENAIRFGLTLIKRVSTGAVDWIMSAESGCQQSTTLKEFIIRCFTSTDTGADSGTTDWRPYSKVGKGDLEALCAAGAFDCFSHDRGLVRASLVPLQELAKKYHEQCCKVKNGKKVRLSPAEVMEAISNYAPTEDMIPDLTLEQTLEDEREVTGCFLSQTPFEPFRWQIKRNQTCTPADLQNDEFDCHGDYLVFAALISDVHEITIKNGKNKGKLMGILKLVGTAGSMEVPVFTDAWNGLKTEQDPAGPQRGKVYLVQVNPDNRNIGKYILQQVTKLSNSGVGT